jgi:hypothetical protein
MKNIPTVIKVALVFILLSALSWLVIGVLIAAQLHPGMPSDPLIKWGMAAASFAAFAVLVVLAWLLAKRRRLAYFIALVALAVVMLLMVFDQMGWVDLVAFIINLVPFLLLLIGRKWFLQPKT